MRKMMVMTAMLALMLLPVPTALAGGPGHNLRVSFQGVATPPGAPIDCPAGFEQGWRSGTVGEGTMTSPVYSDDIVLTETHCSRWIEPDPTTGVAVAKVAGGVIRIEAADSGHSTLVLAFSGTFQLTGDPSGPFSFDTHIVLHFTVTGGSGVFAGARGSGHLTVTGNALSAGELVGSLLLPT